MNNNIIPVTAIEIIRELNEYGYEAYLVGGCVRDMMLDKTPNDWDICTNATPNHTIDVINANNRKYHTVGIEFGTVTVLDGENEFEITTYRSDGEYKDNRRPDSVEFKLDISEDLKRRDFTINAMAYNPITNKLVDLFGGRYDLENKIIRTVGDASVRFGEDALRILRALRFAIVLDFDIQADTFSSMKELVSSLDTISKERITSELEKILKSGKDIKEWFTTADFIIKQIFPEISMCVGFDQNNKYHTHNVYEHMLYVVDYCKTNKFEIKLAALLHDIAKPDAYTEDNEGNGHFYGHPEMSYEICQSILKDRLRLTTEQYERIINLIRYHDMHLVPTNGCVKRAMNKHGIDMLEDWFILKQADMDDHIYPNKNCNYIVDIPNIKVIMQEIIDKQSCFSLKDLDINGNDLIKYLGLKPGKQIGIILNTLLDEVIDDKIINNNKTLLSRASELI